MNMTPYATVDEHIADVKKLIQIADNSFINNAEFQDILRRLPIQYFDEYVVGTEYTLGNKFVHNGMKYMMITDMPKEHLSTDPSLALMRSYCLSFQGMWANLWAFKEVGRQGMLRYPYGKIEEVYELTRDCTSNENTVPPDEDTSGLWVLKYQGEII